MLDVSSIIPLYYQLKEVLKETIKEGLWEEGQKVPSERELIETYKVSRATVRKALNELMVEGLIHRKQGVGTFISKSKLTQDLTGELSFNKQAIKQGLIPSSKIVYSAVETDVPNRISEIFQLQRLHKTINIVRNRLINNEPLMLESLYIPQHFAPNLLEQDLEKTTIFEYLKKECNLNFTHSTLDIEANSISEFEAQYLGYDLGVPALSLERVVYSGNNAVIVQKRKVRGDRLKLSLTVGLSLESEDNYILGLEFNHHRTNLK
ncbi:DNA-binding GntR family transcriptional regulator [Neobacillus niacini]|nr:DNA-binding GntR family transcriptional regulator [Neobacillus niacini]